MKLSFLEQLAQTNAQARNAGAPIVHAIDPERRRKALTDLEGPLEPVFYAKHPTTILVCDDLLASGAKPRKVKLEEFCAQEKFSWAGAPLIHQKRRHRLMEISSRTCFETHALQYWYHGINDLVVVNLDGKNAESPSTNNSPKIKVGKGVFYCPTDNQPRPVGTCMGIYSGLIRSRAEDSEFNPYGFSAGHDGDPSNVFSQCYATGFYHAESHGDLTRLYQHAPTEEELAKISMPQHLKELAITANLVTNAGINSPIPTIAFINRRPLLPNEQVVFSYGAYWDNMEQRDEGSSCYALFDFDGEIMGTVNAKQQFTLNENYRCEGKKPAPRCKPGDDVAAANQLEKLTAVNKDYRPIFLENIRFIVNLHANRKKADGSNFYSKAEVGYIRRMQRIAESSDPEHVLYKIDDVREELSESLTPLLSLSLELCGHMNYYQLQRKLNAALAKQPKVQAAKPALKSAVAEIDKSTITTVYKSLKQATGELGWSIDAQQNLCLVGDKKKLESIRVHLGKQKIESAIEPFPKDPVFCLRVSAARLKDKVLLPMQTPQTLSEKADNKVSLTAKK